LVHFPVQHIGGQLVNARHRSNFALYPCSMDYEQRLDKIAGGKLVLPHQLSHRSRPPAPPRSLE
jgi:hypothetical protein